MLRALARPVDRFGFYSPTARLWLLPEIDGAQLEALGMRVRAIGLQGGYALGPRDGASSAELLERALQVYRGETPAAASSLPSDGVIPSSSPIMHALTAQLTKVAPTALSVLLHGETGVGKDVFARWLHRQSGRRGEFRAINCGAIAPSLLESTLFGHEKGAFTGALKAHKGIFEQAHGGTVFLDEIGELPAEAQVALLRVLETRTVQRVGTEDDIAVDVRIVAATHRPLDAMVEAGTFRRDLLFRLDGFSATVPPLRERPEDVAVLTQAFVQEANQRHGRNVRNVSPLAQEMLRQYSFPGNVRELRNSIDRAVVLTETDTLDVGSFPERMRKPEPAPAPAQAQIAPPAPTATPEVSDLRARLKEYERQLLRSALQQSGGSRAKAAELLQIPLRTLFNKLKDFEVED
jgi:DNA-binding NtrC family response regulator